MNNPHVHIFTDGAARGNPGPGGYGIVMEWVGTPYKKEFSEDTNTQPIIAWNYLRLL